MGTVCALIEKYCNLGGNMIKSRMVKFNQRATKNVASFYVKERQNYEK